MLDPGWQREAPAWSQRSRATIDTVCEHIDHIAQLTGSPDHSGIGSDLDGGFGVEQAPRDLDTISDVAEAADLLRRRGWGEAEVEKVMSGNWLRLLRSVLP
jgi:membrane dipeptidase